MTVDPLTGTADDYRVILRRVGVVLIAVGVLDILFMIYCIVNGMSYSSSLNIFAVIAGIAMLRGSLSAASYVRCFAALFLAVMCSMFALIPVIVPLDLLVTWFRLNSLQSLAAGAACPAMLYFFYWTEKQLGLEPVESALKSSAIRYRNPRNWQFVGVGIVALACGFMAYLESSQWEHAAAQAARAQVGDGYKFFMSSLSIGNSGSQSKGSARVVAWNRGEIRVVSVKVTDP